MKPILAIFVTALLAGCASSSGTPAQPSIHQRLTVECKASNTRSPGCKTTHDIAIIATLGRAEPLPLPSIADLPAETAGPPTY